MIKKLTSKHVFMIVLAVGVLALLLVYLNVFVAYNDKTEELKKSNAELQKQVDDMKVYYDMIGTYQKGSADMAAAMDELLEDYPADAKEEDAIMMAVNMQNVALLNYESIAIGSQESLLAIPKDMVTAANVEGMENPIDFKSRTVNYNNTTTYAHMKMAVEEVYASPYRIGIDSISYKRKAAIGEPWDIIEGNIVISYYSLDGLGREYVAPTMPTYAPGNPQLFGLPISMVDEAPVEPVAAE
ncbi:MAG: hypothetical protein NC079_01230 [Clostridium sp.]|nr:hypothetical protein [Acetatifactor muris]MCM1526030.1 hypothetical protein [Bacteroides sp.]MCM1562210.1 hypothetical protein [Clostridium sp.]